MQSVIDLINAHATRYPEFGYYIDHMREGVSHVHTQPDRCIENCKAVFEGICKALVLRMDSGTDRKKVDKFSLPDLVDRAISCIERHDTSGDFPASLIRELASTLGTLRNRRGDVSHGRAAPKDEASGDRLSRCLLANTETALRYMLEIFYEQPGVLAETTSAIPQINYEDNPDFNDWVDAGDYHVGRVLFSLALFNQDYESYLDQLEDFERLKAEAEAMSGSFSPIQSVTDAMKEGVFDEIQAGEEPEDQP